MSGGASSGGASSGRASSGGASSGGASSGGASSGGASSGTLIVEGKVEVRCSKEAAWDLFCRFGDIAALIPSVEGVEVDGDRVDARVATRLGALPVSSRVTLQVIEREPFACLKAEGISYLGETFVEQIQKRVDGISGDSAGRLLLHLDLREGETAEVIVVAYVAEVEAKGRLKRIYQAILKTKVPSMMEEFAANIRGALETAASTGAPAEAPARGSPAQGVSEPRAAAPASAAGAVGAGASDARGAPPGEAEPLPIDARAARDPEPARAEPAPLASPSPGLLVRLWSWLRALTGRFWRPT